MKRRNAFTIAISLLLLGAMMIHFAGCAVRVQAADLMDGIEARELGAVPAVTPESAAKAADFAVRLFRAGQESGKNTLLSPLSVLAALSMTANGARGETLAEMERVLGMSKEELNVFYRSYVNALSDTKKDKLRLANSIWFTSDEHFTVKREFLQTNADYYGASAYKAPFDDTTLNDINNWVKNKTDGMIPNILDKIQGAAVMYLVNALAFEAEWTEIYQEDQIGEGTFTREDGTETKVDFMYSTESQYLEDDTATGFLKFYSGGKYAFAALLPKEGVSVDDLVASLDGEKLYALLSEPQTATVETSLPKFETEFGTDLKETLIAMGMPSAFDDASADFRDLGTSKAGNIFIGRVIHKTFISVGEKGTKAGAATVVEMLDECAPDFEDAKQVYLDRPFVYLLIDTETNLPFFIGTMMDVAA